MDIDKLLKEFRNHIYKYGFRILKFDVKNLYGQNLKVEELIIKTKCSDRRVTENFNCRLELLNKRLNLEDLTLYLTDDSLQGKFITEGFTFDKEPWSVF